ncbi:MAG: coproporphyrinogen III oxidase family protein [Coriobacteriia bacterium]|nr:coproporphyrinogen III oxidase family protein [Coriobacteriia bacterium]
MLAERALSIGTRVLNKNYLSGDVGADVDMLPAAEPDKMYMLYVHIPFCRQLCTYCSFNRFYFKEDRTRAYFVSLRRELEMVKELDYRFGAMYIGGGTPTVLLDELCDIIDYAKQLFPDIKDVSTETNPADLGDELFDALMPRVARLSVGVQSFDNDLLQQMSRIKTTGTAEDTLAAVQSTQGKFDSFNVDMIFNFPSQTFAMLQRDLELVKQTGCNQTTFYPLLASPLRRKQMAQAVGAVDYSREYEMYKMICDDLYGAGFVGSSAWTFSACKDMIIDEYIVDFPEYVGIGSGAMSYLRGQNYTNTFSLRQYHEAIAKGTMPIATMTQGSKSKVVDMRYYFATKLFGLRLDKQEFRDRFGVDIARGLPVEMTFMRAAGAFATDDDKELTLTAKGRYLTLVMMRETLAGSNDHRDQMRAELDPAEHKELLDEESNS